MLVPSAWLQASFPLVVFEASLLNCVEFELST